MNTRIDYLLWNKRQTGWLPQRPRYHRRRCDMPAFASIVDGETKEAAEGALGTAPPWTVVVETDPTTGIVRYVIDGERCRMERPGPETEANRALIEGAHGLLAAAWLAYGWLLTPPAERIAGGDAEVARALAVALSAAEGRGL